jgi:aminodeoxyfutalosine deaminase
VDYFLGLDLQGQAFLLAHVNYITDEELVRLSQTGHSVVYCPRSHGYFGHPDHSFVKMLGLGINVCLGTDSLASNSSLSLLEEMRYLHRRYPAVPPEVVVRMATLNGAVGLGWDDKIGSLAPGNEADLIAIPLAKPDREPCRDILESDSQPVMVMVGGEVVHKI